MAQASPQLEDGYVRIANDYLEALVCRSYPASLLRFVLAVLREVWGWQRKERAVPISRFMELLDVGERRIYQLRDDAVRHNLIVVQEQPGGDAIYSIQKLPHDWLDYSSKRPAKKKSLSSIEARPSEARPAESAEARPSEVTEARPSPETEGRASVSINDVKDKKENPKESNGGGGDLSENKRQAGKRLFIGPSPDAVLGADWGHLANNYPNLAATIEAFVRWAKQYQLGLFRALVNAINSPADEWVPDEAVACGLVEEYPPLSTEQHLPAMWMQRVQAVAQKRLDRNKRDQALLDWQAEIDAEDAERQAQEAAQ